MKIKVTKGIFGVLFICVSLSCNSGGQKEDTSIQRHIQNRVESSLDNEVFYHVFQRSFYDSDGDLQGDLNGITHKLDYLDDLGVTSILMVPLYSSIYYHNYFADDFYKIDEEYGTIDDYFNLVKELHNRNMKLYMDMEIHYVTKNHIWFRDSYKNPNSEYSDYVFYNGENNTNPESMIFGLTSLESFDGKEVDITTINMHNEGVKTYLTDLFKYWVDPNKDGDFTDGVDGFRIDHMMDDLDEKGINTDLLSSFWAPIIQELKSINPELKILAEQADWEDLGSSYFTKSDVDVMFGFSIREALTDLDKEEVLDKTSELLKATPANKYQLLFIENHDTDRYATVVEGNLEKQKLAAAYTILTKGVPLLYYGQEIGMKGDGGFGVFGSSDGNDIPMREAFEWYKTVEGTGMALWYKNSGPWWDNTNLADNDGISFEEQVDNPKSLWNFYRSLIEIKQKYSSFKTFSEQKIISTDNDIIALGRNNSGEKFILLFNTSDEAQVFITPDSSKTQLILNSGNVSLDSEAHTVKLSGYAFGLIELL